jgi:RsiW-degrading membrane proteinase PrsW (M82 family)
MKRGQIAVSLHRPSISEKLFFFISGAIVSVPLTLFYQLLAAPLLTNLSALDIALVSAAVFAPFLEEFSKIFPLYYRHGETQRSIFNLALLVGLGFGIVEFLTYIFLAGVSPIDRLPGLLFHPASTSISAYGVATKKPVRFFLVAVMLHFLNNFFALFDSALPTTVVIVAITVFLSWKLYDRTKEKFIDSNPCTPMVEAS